MFEYQPLGLAVTIRNKRFRRIEQGSCAALLLACAGCSGSDAGGTVPTTQIGPGVATPEVATQGSVTTSPPGTAVGSGEGASPVVPPVAPGVIAAAPSRVPPMAQPDTGAVAPSVTGASTTAPTECNGFDVGETPLQRLSSRELRNSVQTLFGVTASVATVAAGDEGLGVFIQNVGAPVSEPVVSNYSAFAEQVAAEVVNKIDQLQPCVSPDASCAAAFINQYAPLVYRRPLETGEPEELLGVFEVGRDFQTGMRLVVETLLQSPYFLYRLEFRGTEVAPGVLKLSPYELAARLSFALHGTTPDQALFNAAGDGSLNTPEGLGAMVDALLEDPKAQETVGDFHLQWLGVSGFEGASKDSGLFPQFDETLKQSMVNEVARFANQVVLEGDARLETLMTAPFTFPEAALFPLYGLPDPGANHDPNQRVDLAPGERSGLLTMPAVMAAHAEENQTSPIQRGIWVRENLLCQTLPDPPQGLDTTPPDLSSAPTARARFSIITENPICASCHTLIDPIGLGFENYDAIGAYRQSENGQAIDSSGTVTGLQDSTGEFTGATELANLLLQDTKLSSCVSRQWFRYILARAPNQADACAVGNALATFSATDFNILQLIKSIVTSDSFQHVKGAL